MKLFSPIETISNEIRTTEKSALENGFPFAEISTIAEAESWRKEIYRPIYHLHKWWAQRLGSVFRSIILAAASPEHSSVLELFYQKNDLDGLIVFDPFMGSGTTIGEAIKLGCTVIGKDINPVAYHAVRAAFSRISHEDAYRTFKTLEMSVGTRLKALYRLGDHSQVLYFFWVKQVACPGCKEAVDLFNNYIFARHAYPTRRPTSQCLCPQCGEVFSCRYDSSKEQCPSCSYTFNPQHGPAERTKARCSNCHHTFPIVNAVKATGVPPVHRMYAKMVLCPNGEKEYRRITKEDTTALDSVRGLLRREPPLIDQSPLEPGYNTNQAINYGYTRWDQFFNDRQLLGLTWLGKAIQNIEDPDIRFVFAVLFSGALEFNNMFCSFKGEGTGAVRHMFSHHILKPERQPIEANIWGTPKSSGAFSTLFRTRLLRALDYRTSPFEIEIEKEGEKIVGRKHLDCNMPISESICLVNSGEQLRPRSVYLSCGDSANTDLPSKSVDLVITDPPFFDNVHYSELADFFYAWQRPLLGDVSNWARTTRSPQEVQDRDATKFSEKLASVFRECHRVLKDTGILAFTYHHSRDEGWASVAHAVTSAGFHFVSAQPVKAEMSVAAPKSQAKEPIDLDIILVCRKNRDDRREFLGSEAALESSITNARIQIEQFSRQNRRLSRNDIKIIIFSHLLVNLSFGLIEKDLIKYFNDFSYKLNEIVENIYTEYGQYRVFGNNSQCYQ